MPEVITTLNSFILLLPSCFINLCPCPLWVCACLDARMCRMLSWFRKLPHLPFHSSLFLSLLTSFSFSASFTLKVPVCYKYVFCLLPVQRKWQSLMTMSWFYLSLIIWTSGERYFFRVIWWWGKVITWFHLFGIQGHIYFTFPIAIAMFVKEW